MELPESIEELEALQAQVKAKLKELYQARNEAFWARAWERVRHLSRGEALYCAIGGTMIGGIGLQRGDKVTVYAVQPRKKRLWITLKNGKSFGLSPRMVHHYNLQLDRPPKKKGPQFDRKLAARLGKVFNEE